MWNLESGAKRKTFRVGARTKGSRRTDGCTVTGIATDSLNRSVIATTLEGTVNVRELTVPSIAYTLRDWQFFDFHTTTLEHTLLMRSGAVSIVLNRSSGLLGVICDDMVVRIIDVETRKVVRELSGFRGRILDIVCVRTISLCQDTDVDPGILARLKMAYIDIIRLHHPDF
jgi:U3 small nucleolar RNA-associated protein 21